MKYMLDNFLIKAYTVRDKWEFGVPIIQEVMQNPMSARDNNIYFIRVHKDGYDSDWNLPYVTEDIEIKKPLSICRFTGLYANREPVYEWDILMGVMQYNDKELIVIPNLECIQPKDMEEYIKGYNIVGNMHNFLDATRVDEKYKDKFRDYMLQYQLPNG